MEGRKLIFSALPYSSTSWLRISVFHCCLAHSFPTFSYKSLPRTKAHNLCYAHKIKHPLHCKYGGHLHCKGLLNKGLCLVIDLREKDWKVSVIDIFIFLFRIKGIDYRDFNTSGFEVFGMFLNENFLGLGYTHYSSSQYIFWVLNLVGLLAQKAKSLPPTNFNPAFFSYKFQFREYLVLTIQSLGRVGSEDFSHFKTALFPKAFLWFLTFYLCSLCVFHFICKLLLIIFRA